jgi:chemotaxis protein methyltransferase CheR
VTLSAPVLSDQEFGLFRDFIEEEAGLHLSDNKKSLLAGRLMRRLRQLECASYSAYFEHVVASDVERRTLLDLIVTNETRFFREPHQFSYLENFVYPRWIESGRSEPVRVWSAGCSTGEEPFSIAMSLLHYVPALPVEVLGTDVSGRVLETAVRATWTLKRAESVPPHLRNTYMLRGVGRNAGLVRATPELRSVVRFARLNLHRDELDGLPVFDLIFCRNVLIYFEHQARVRAIRRMMTHLAPGGLLFVGHAETLNRPDFEARSVAPSIYQRRVFRTIQEEASCRTPAISC